MATFNKFQPFVENIAEGLMNLGTDTLEVALTTAANAPTATMSLLAELTQISYTNLSSRVLTRTSSSQSGGVYKLALADLVLTASGDVATFRNVVIFDQTAVGDPLIGWYTHTEDVTLHNAETFTIDFDPSTGVMQLT